MLLSICLGLGYVGLGASLFHLGRPHLAYRALLGWRHSWLSREVLAFGAFISLASLFVLAQEFTPGLVVSHPRMKFVLLLAVVAFGACGVGSSVMVACHGVRRPFWRASASGVKFTGTTVLLGLATAVLSLAVSMNGALDGATASAEFLLPLVAGAVALVSAAKFLYQAADYRERHGSADVTDPLRLTARLLRGPLKGQGTLRLVLGFSGGVLLPLIAVLGHTFWRRSNRGGWRGSRLAVVDRRRVDRAHLVLSRSHSAKDDGGPAFMKTVRRPESLLGRLQSMVHAKEGRLTRELVRGGRFGLGQVPAGKNPDATTVMVCGFCSTGCRPDRASPRRRGHRLSPTTDYSVNRGMACPKGWEALTVLDAADRATVPLLRGEADRLLEVTWHEAMTTMAARFHAIQAEYGAESIAFLSTGQIATEEMALLGAVAKFGMGMVHGDGNTRQCMASAAVAYKQAFGFDAPPYTYQDLEESDCIVLIGANPCIAHPVLWDRATRNTHSPEVIVIDPRRTETAMAATLHLPVRPKSDLLLLYGIAHLLIERGAIDRCFVGSHTRGFDEFAEFVRRFDPAFVASETGLNAQSIIDAAGRIERSERVSFWWTMGVNQSHQGVKTAQAAINLALLTGNIGRPGTGANSITGQCNAMGSRLFSNTTNLLGGRDFTNAAHREHVANVLDIPEERIPSRPSWSYDGIIAEIKTGAIRGLWVVATNPAHSWIDQSELREAFAKLDFLVVQDMYSLTETAALADLLLPAAGWGEKEGTFINSERRVGLIKRCRVRNRHFRTFTFLRWRPIILAAASSSRNGSRPRRFFKSSNGFPRASLAISAASPTITLSTTLAACSGLTRRKNRTVARSGGSSRMAGFIIRTLEPGSSSPSPGRCQNRPMPRFHFSFLRGAAAQRSGIPRRARPSQTCFASSTRATRI